MIIDQKCANCQINIIEVELWNWKFVENILKWVLVAICGVTRNFRKHKNLPKIALCMTHLNFRWNLLIVFWGCIYSIKRYLGKPSFVKKKDFLWNHFIKWWPPVPLLWSPYFFFFRPFFERKKRWFWRLFEGCWWVF